MEPSEEQPNYILPEGLFLDSKLPAIILANIIAIEDRMFAFESLPTKIVWLFPLFPLLAESEKV